MRPEDAQTVRRLPLLEGAEASSITTLIAAGYVQRFPGGVVLIHEGERPDFLHILVEGQVDLFTNHRGREATIAVISPPTTFILAAVIVDGPYLKSARTIEPTTVVLIPAEAVRDVFARDPGFARATVAELACRYRSIVKDLKNHRLRPAVERLANWLIAQDQLTGGQGTFRIPFEKRLLASKLGMRPENLSRAFAELTQVGVEVSGATIRIESRAALERFAMPNPLIDGEEPCQV